MGCHQMLERIQIMSKTKDWMMTMDDLISDAFDKGATDANDVIAYLSTNLPVVDENYVRKSVDEILSPVPESTGDEWYADIDNVVCDRDKELITFKEAVEKLNALGLDSDMARGCLAK